MENGKVENLYSPVNFHISKSLEIFDNHPFLFLTQLESEWVALIAETR